MKTWEKYSEYLLKGEWHIHTNYTDGKNSVYECCQKAAEVGIPLVAFTEHVKKHLDYDFCSFLNDIDKAKEEFDLIILSGCETKVLPNGDLDVNDDILKEIDYPIFAFHSFPADVGIYFDSLKSVLKNKYVNTWAHPGAFLKKKGLQIPDDQLVIILNLMSKQKILLEINCKYDVPSAKWIDLAKMSDICLVRGSDVHNIDSFCPL